jgi:hypothetical protein
MIMRPLYISGSLFASAAPPMFDRITPLSSVKKCHRPDVPGATGSVQERTWFWFYRLKFQLAHRKNDSRSCIYHP